jgi:hypothetical protein
MEASSELWALEGSVKERRRSGLQHFLWMGFEPTLLRDLESKESCLWAATREGIFFFQDRGRGARRRRTRGNSYKFRVGANFCLRTSYFFTSDFLMFVFVLVGIDDGHDAAMRNFAIDVLELDRSVLDVK